MGEPTALPVGCAERCTAGGSTDRQGGWSRSSPASDAEHFSRDAHGVEKLEDSREYDQKPRRGCRGLGEGLMGFVGLCVVGR